MTTTTTALVNNDESSFLPSSLFNIQYPNCRTGMFSLREPFKDMPPEVFPTEEEQQVLTRNFTSAAVQTNFSNDDQVPPIQEQPIEPIPIQPRQRSKRNAGVQCSLLTPNIHREIAVQTKIDRQRTPVNQLYDDNDVSPRHYRHRKLQPVEQYQKFYEIWDVESPSLRTIPINQTIRRKEVPRARYVRHRKPFIEYPDEEEMEYDNNEERIIYAHQPRKAIKKTYLPPNVRMICVRDDANKVSY